jgi:uncharacterized protein
VDIFLVGCTGFIGHILAPAFLAHGHRVTLLVRPGETWAGEGIRLVAGEPSKPGEWQKEAGDHDAIVNLAGASIFRRWTRTARHEIMESRIEVTRRVVEALAARRREKARLFNASGVGYYGFHGDEILTEGTPGGTNFIAQVAVQWEEEAQKASSHGVPVVLCRFGIVLGRAGGALPRLILLAKRRAAAPFGRGRQWFSWIHQQDMAGAFLHLLQKENVAGPVNFAAPNPVRNKELMSLLAQAMQRRSFIPAIPGPLLKLFYGEFATVFLKGQRTTPAVLLKEGFRFAFPTLSEALSDLLTLGR